MDNNKEKRARGCRSGPVIKQNQKVCQRTSSVWQFDSPFSVLIEPIRLFLPPWIVSLSKPRLSFMIVWKHGGEKPFLSSSQRRFLNWPLGFCSGVVMDIKCALDQLPKVLYLASEPHGPPRIREVSLSARLHRLQSERWNGVFVQERDRRYRNTREKMPPFALCPFSRVTSVEQREVRAELSLCKDGKLRLKAALWRRVGSSEP